MAKSSQSLKQHIGLNHLSTDMFRCDYCHELFVEKDQLMSHSIKHKKQLSVKKWRTHWKTSENFLRLKANECHPFSCDESSNQ
jgi:hypothetical protein